ncbi:MAG: hypothetical protein K2X39_03700, partial [Silvanigrellaceae bacterium]|nr:hypothetical protein [Silvanigrellaceae bacterium]
MTTKKKNTSTIPTTSHFEHLSEQIGLIHGVLEEICERQELLSLWQIQHAKRMATLDEAQWRVLEDMIGKGFQHPVERI